AFAHPLVFGVALLAVLILSVWLTWHSWRFLSGLVRKVIRVFAGRSPTAAPAFAPALAPQALALVEPESGA
ncbi:MAG: hypothetical protein LBH10_05600, partial [Burkholderiaceae bacterium]|nr:hypothetical protein [Burkholderiaceae bacterium]